MSEPRHPSELELAILRALWRRGTATVRRVFEDVERERRLGYNTVLKTMLILLGKGMVLRDDSERSHVYRSAFKEQEIQAALLRDLLQRAFGGSGKEFVLAAIKEAPLLPGDLGEIMDFSILKARTNTVNNLRKFARRSLAGSPQVQIQEANSFYSPAINISMGGLLLGPAPSLTAGAPCVLSIASGKAGNSARLKGTVIRSDASGTAIRFIKPLNERAYSNIVTLLSSKEISSRVSA